MSHVDVQLVTATVSPAEMAGLSGQSSEKNENDILIVPVEVRSQRQFAKSKYASQGTWPEPKTETVPEPVSLDGVHEQPPEQVRAPVQKPTAYLPATHDSHVVLPVSPFVLLPAAQSLQTDAPAIAANFPGAHPSQLVACPVAENFPGAQTHAPACALAAGDVVFCGHGTQDAEPDVFLYLPVSHGMHSPDSVVPKASNAPPRPVYPATQRHDATPATSTAAAPIDSVISAGQPEQVAMPCTAHVSAEQLLHGALPATDLYLPARQALHAPPSGPVYAALHVQALIDALCPYAFVFAGHCKHAVAPYTCTYFPSLQFVHAVAAAAENCPGAQGVHWSRPAAENFPAAHCAHVVAPVSSVYFPGTHKTHAVAAAAENCPGAQDVHWYCPAAENFPAAHSAHVVAPVSFVYFPGTHVAHVALPADAAIFPGTHDAHGSAAALALPATQSPHDDAPSAEKRPAGHAVHAWSPAVFLYVPAAHALQHTPVLHSLLWQQLQQMPHTSSSAQYSFCGG